jgi:hypothetical protein
MTFTAVTGELVPAGAITREVLNGKESLMLPTPCHSFWSNLSALHSSRSTPARRIALQVRKRNVV